MEIYSKTDGKYRVHNPETVRARNPLRITLRLPDGRRWFGWGNRAVKDGLLTLEQLTAHYRERGLVAQAIAAGFIPGEHTLLTPEVRESLKRMGQSARKRGRDRPARSYLTLRNERFKPGVPVAENIDELLEELYVEQQGRCYATGLPLKMDLKDAKDDCYRTVDQIVPGLGYVKGNMRLVCAVVNRLKSNMTLIELEGLVEYVRRAQAAA